MSLGEHEHTRTHTPWQDVCRIIFLENKIFKYVMQVSFQLISVVLVCLQSEADFGFSATKTTVPVYAPVVRMRQKQKEKEK